MLLADPVPSVVVKNATRCSSTQSDYGGSQTKGNSSTLVGDVQKFDSVQACTWSSD